MNLKQVIFLLLMVKAGSICSQPLSSFKFKTDHQEVVNQLYQQNFFIETALLNSNLNLLLYNLRSLGYLEASVDSIINQDSISEIHLHVGNQYQWMKLDPGNVPEEILSEIGFRERFFSNKPFDVQDASKLFHTVVQYYENNGFPFAQIKLVDVEIKNEGIIAGLFLEKGPLIIIDNFYVKGSSLISEKYIQTFLDIKPGDVYNQSTLVQVNQRIKEIPFVKEIKPSELVFKEGKADLYLYLDRKKASLFNGIVGVLPDNQTGKVNVTGDINLRIKNGLNKGELIDFNWRKLQPLTQDLVFNFNFPFIMNSSFGTDYKFKLYKRDSTFIEVNNDIAVQYHLRGNNFVKLFLKNSMTNVIDSNVYINQSSLPDLADTKTIVYGLGLRKSKLDYRLNPRKGFQIEMSGAVGIKRIFKSDKLDEQFYTNVDLKTNQYYGDFLAEAYLPIGKRSTVKFGNKTGLIYSDNLFVNEMFRIGGIKTLRGFDEESITASFYTISTVEYRFLLGRNSNLFVFSEGAYYQNKSVSSLIEDFPIGFGAGISFETGLGIFSINYALGTQQGNPVNFNSSKIHFGFVNFF